MVLGYMWPSQTFHEVL